MKLSFEVWPNMPWGRLEAAGPAWNSWGDLSSAETATKVAEYGYDAVDFLLGHLMNGPASEYEANLAATKAAADAAGIEIGYVANHTTFVSPREYDRERGIESFKKALDAAKALGAKSACTLLGDGFYDPPLNVLMSRREA
jgi:sugar phosphate isomerase/epimerase